ncbi:unnamed protein product [Aphis gossypii]|uniref:Purple acid phosphatase n=1 Tax=Aphis gossypii TaxID=80765 RepID=A0A9P0NNN6_APHGO|nr:unnamed protein product [Aphis gossypii]
MKTCQILVILTIFGFCAADPLVRYQPEQIHLSLGESETELVVTWTTWNNTDESVVKYGINGPILKATGSSTLFVDGGELHRTQYIHRVKLTGLQPSSKYVYYCGSNQGWSPQFWFNTVPSDTNWSPSLAFFGDLGNVNAQSLPRLQEETERGLYDMILHIGDFAYDMDSENAKVGDEFMRQLEPIASYVPYMTCPGNHEQKYNFSNYKARFSMPGGYENMMYSFNLGPAHFISISTEFYYFLYYGIKPVVLQYEWLVNDLKEANKPENRKQRPWIIVYGHRPMYCSDDDKDDCTYHETITRVGLPLLHWFGLENLFYDNGVDLCLWGHEHTYERMWPVYDRTVYNGSYLEPYTNPGAPVHITSGSAGCQERTDNFIPNPPYWSAIRNSDYGYGRLKIYNSTHLYAEQVSDDRDGEVIDHIWLIKDHHKPYGKSTSK